MKKLTISGLVIFVVFFLAATLVWFVHDKDIYKRLKYNETFHQSSISKLNIDSYSSDITIFYINCAMITIIINTIKFSFFDI